MPFHKDFFDCLYYVYCDFWVQTTVVLKITVVIFYMVNGNFRPKESLFHVEKRGSNQFNPISKEQWQMLLRHVDSLCINTIKKE